jgi:Dolichyl-phosphate-mannose-protein mannosyltransferase
LPIFTKGIIVDIDGKVLEQESKSPFSYFRSLVLNLSTPGSGDGSSEHVRLREFYQNQLFFSLLPLSIEHRNREVVGGISCCHVIRGICQPGQIQAFGIKRESTLQYNYSDRQSLPHSIRATLDHLFFREKDPSYIYLILGVITLIGFVLRLTDINKYVAYDEAYTFIHFASREFKHILADYSAPNNHIFHTILVGIAYRLFGGQPWVLRLPAFTAGILMIPAMYITARRFFSSSQALAASALIAVTPSFITYSVNARGYTLLFLFTLLLTNFAGILVAHQSKPTLIAFTLTTVLGFYTIPIFLYPWAGISLWIVATYLFAKEPWKNRYHNLAIFFGICILSGLFTLVLYSPVIIFGSGLSSIVSNEIVKPLNWSTFLENLDPRLIKAWNKWMRGVGSTGENLFSGGFLLSLLLYRKVSNQILPMQVFLALAVAILVVLQRVTPLPRIWLYLEVFYLMFAMAGLVWLAELLINRFASPLFTEKILSLAIMLVFIGVFANRIIARQQNPVFQDRDLLPEAYAADYLAAHLTPEDTIVATGPVDIQTAYYLSLHDIPFERFYQRDHPVKIRNALVILRQNSKYKTPESVVDFFKLDQALDMNQSKLVYEYANVQIYSIPAK